MLSIHCPWCGRRDETEFSYGGQAHIARPDPKTASDVVWSEYLYLRDNERGWFRERWRHTHGCGQWFNALRHTATHEIKSVYRMDEPKPEPDK